MEQRGRHVYYYLAESGFQYGELKLLVDAVQSSRFITVRQSRELIRKINGLASKKQQKRLNEQLSYTDNVKTENENFFHVVGSLHEAINAKKQIRFQYMRWNARKELELRNNGAWYQVSPLGLVWDAENYYLVAYNTERRKVCHYRVDKIKTNLEILDLRWDKLEDFRTFKISDLPKSSSACSAGRRSWCGFGSRRSSSACFLTASARVRP